MEQLTVRRAVTASPAVVHAALLDVERVALDDPALDVLWSDGQHRTLTRRDRQRTRQLVLHLLRQDAAAGTADLVACLGGERWHLSCRVTAEEDTAGSEVTLHAQRRGGGSARRRVAHQTVLDVADLLDELARTLDDLAEPVTTDGLLPV